MFNPGWSIGQILNNADLLVEEFKCGNMVGMRRFPLYNGHEWKSGY